MNALTEWQKSDERRKMADDILRDPRFQEMMRVIYADHPMVDTRLPKDGADATGRLGEIIGYQKCINKFQQMREAPPPIPETVNITWNAEDTGDTKNERS